jgi:hypothetical protein
MRGRNNALTSSLHTIERYALNRNGDVGSLYNARTDNLLITSPINKDLLVQKDIREIPNCRSIEVYDRDHDDILKLIGIDDDLRISIALGMTTITEGTSMLHTYDLPADRTVRLIDYCRVDQEECLPDDVRIVKKILPDSLPDNNATHIITNVKRGIDFIILLELPENTNHNEIDSVLKKICDYFTIPITDFPSIEDQQKLNCLRPTIFTSITEIHSFAENKDLSVICQCIHQYIYQNRNRSTLSYTMHPVKCIYYEELSNDMHYCELDARIVWKIEEKLLPLSNRLKQLEYRSYVKLKPQLLQFVETLIELTSKDLCKAKTMYVEIQEALSRKVDEFRQGKLDRSLFEDVFNDARLKILDAELKTLQTTVIELEKKVLCISNTEIDRQMKYNNGADSENLNKDQANREGNFKHFLSITYTPHTILFL